MGVLHGLILPVDPAAPAAFGGSITPSGRIRILAAHVVMRRRSIRSMRLFGRGRIGKVVGGPPSAVHFPRHPAALLATDAWRPLAQLADQRIRAHRGDHLDVGGLIAAVSGEIEAVLMDEPMAMLLDAWTAWDAEMRRIEGRAVARRRSGGRGARRQRGARRARRSRSPRSGARREPPQRERALTCHPSPARRNTVVISRACFAACSSFPAATRSEPPAPSSRRPLDAGDPSPRSLRRTCMTETTPAPQTGADDHAPKTLAEKVWADHLVKRGEDGAPDLVYIDLHLVHEVTSPQAFDGLRAEGRPVRRPDLTIATEDHNTPTIDIDKPIADLTSRTQIETLRAQREGVRHPPALARRRRAGHRARRRAAARPHACRASPSSAATRTPRRTARSARWRSASAPARSSTCSPRRRCR